MEVGEASYVHPSLALTEYSLIWQGPGRGAERAHQTRRRTLEVPGHRGATFGSVRQGRGLAVSAEFCWLPGGV